MDRGLLTAGFSEGEDLIPAPAGCDPVSRFAYEMPPRVRRLGEGHYLADLGQEIVGTVALDVPGAAVWRADALHGAEVRLYMGEQLCPEPGTDGTLVKWNMNTGNRYRLAWRLPPGRPPFIGRLFGRAGASSAFLMDRLIFPSGVTASTRTFTLSPSFKNSLTSLT